MVEEDWLPAHPEGVLRLLSLPSSTGEEPYSIAMTLLDAGVPADRFRVHALDISARALAAAGRAVYRKNSFRSHDLGFRARHFELTSSGYRVSDLVRQQVSFERSNLFAVDLLSGVQIYDVIFCRNLLIYFDRSTQERAIGVLERLLTPTGVLFVAPSEAGLLLSHGFVSTKVPLAFAFRKAGSGTREPKPRAIPAVRRLFPGITSDGAGRQYRAPPRARHRGSGCSQVGTAGRSSARPQRRTRAGRAIGQPGSIPRGGHVL